MATGAKKAARRGGRPPKPKAEKYSVTINLRFSQEQGEILARAAAKRFDSRGNWGRRTLLEAAFKELGMDPPEDAGK